MSNRHELSSGWIELLGLIPDYDPFDHDGSYYFDCDAAEAAIDFFPRFLCHVKGELTGQAFKLQRWQQSIIANLFGWKHGETGLRRYREGLVIVPRKNGKSLMSAGVGVVVLYSDGEKGAEIYCAAAERDQAGLVFDMAKEMVLKNRSLSKHSSIYAKAITVRTKTLGLSSFKAISADANTKHGYNAHCVIFDELHAQKNRDLVDVLSTSMGARSQPLMLYVTTADFYRESICNETYEYACKIRDKVFSDDSFLPVIYEAKKEDDWTDEAVWAKANPNLGVSVSLEFLRSECRKAQEVPSRENTFKRLYLNIQTEQDVRWIQMEKWDACTLEVPEPGSRECFGGLDLASTTDVAAFAMTFREGSSWCLIMRFWVPEEKARERSQMTERALGSMYNTWAKQGFLTLTAGNVIDYDVIRRDINALQKTFNLSQIACDRWNSTQLVTQLKGDGFDVVEWGQGYASMSAPAKELEAQVVSGNLRHGGNPVLRWMASNVSAEEDAAGNIKPSKKKSINKIDGIVAATMAIGLASALMPPTRSVYEDRGFVTV